MIPQTPFYYYDTALLRQTLDIIRREVEQYAHYHVHYAMKANVNPKVLAVIQQAGFGADCVSGGEVQRALDAGFAADKIVYAGVGKSDRDILLALRNDIYCFNVESSEELQIINELAQKEGRVARVCLRINPDVAAHTHSHITTGKAENKFGIALEDMDWVVKRAMEMKFIQFMGLHFHIGSQILDMADYVALCKRVNSIQDILNEQGLYPKIINVGGGLGIDYDHPDKNSIADFKAYFSVFAEHLCLRDGQQVHFELGRSVVAQCGSLITRVLYVKHTSTRKFAIVDAGMTDLVRPALYGAKHTISKLGIIGDEMDKYDVVGPICESSDVFGREVMLPAVGRGDLLAIHSAGAYGECMASRYNCRELPESYTSEELMGLGV